MAEPHYTFLPSLRKKLFVIVFGTETRAGKLFDIVLLCAILASVLMVMLESVKEIDEGYHTFLVPAEWFFTILFSIEYIVRIFISKKPLKYVFSFLGIVDLLALIPTYLSLFITGGSYLVVIRSIRLLRVFRILKLGRYLREASVLTDALVASRHKIMVFLGAVLTLVVIMGTLMYMIEGGESGFTSIPRSIYWAIVTVTTVGYGDIAPQTIFGQVVASLLMLMGYAILAVPTGIVTSEITHAQSEERRRKKRIIRVCNGCGYNHHVEEAKYCQQCGDQLD